MDRKPPLEFLPPRWLHPERLLEHSVLTLERFVLNDALPVFDLCPRCGVVRFTLSAAVRAEGLVVAIARDARPELHPEVRGRTSRIRTLPSDSAVGISGKRDVHRVLVAARLADVVRAALPEEFVHAFSLALFLGPELGGVGVHLPAVRPPEVVRKAFRLKGVQHFGQRLVAESSRRG